jgi:hypothetical protein
MKRPIVATAALGLFALVASVQTGAQTPAAAGPTFTKDVAPILYKSCTNCHRPGEIAPMSLLTTRTRVPGRNRLGPRCRRARCHRGTPTPRTASS